MHPKAVAEEQQKKRQGEKLFAHYHDKKAPLSNTAPRETVICKQTCLLIHVKVSLGNLILQVYKYDTPTQKCKMKILMLIAH